MKAVIFNSGLGNRMEDFTKHNHKSMARLKDGETIFHRQLRLLSAEGIKDFIVTTGPFEDQLKAEAADFPELNFTFVRNEIFDKTNYIYSMYLAREYMQDDLLFLHGDGGHRRGAGFCSTRRSYGVAGSLRSGNPPAPVSVCILQPGTDGGH